MAASRRFGVFAVTFAIAYPILYLVTTEMNWPAFTYHPAFGEFGLGAERSRQGLPAMYWFGWITTSAAASLVIAAIVAHLPENLSLKPPAALAWVVPLVAMVTAAGLMMNMYFTR